MSIKTLLLLVLTACFVGCSNQGPDIIQSDAEGFECEYTYSIKRDFTSTFEEGLVKQAETYYPSRDSVVAAAVAAGQSADEIPDEKYWWYRVQKGIKVPYSLTTEAIDYFSGLVDSAQREAEPNCMNRRFLVRYTASVSYKEKFVVYNYGEDTAYNDVYVVMMRLSWDSEAFDDVLHWTTGYHDYRERLVVFDKEGQLLDVYFDGQTLRPIIEPASGR